MLGTKSSGYQAELELEKAQVWAEHGLLSGLDSLIRLERCKERKDRALPNDLGSSAE
jgi:hypothetical protein